MIKVTAGTPALEYEVIAWNNEFCIIQQLSNTLYYYDAISVRGVQDAKKIAKDLGISDMHSASFVSLADIQAAIKEMNETKKIYPPMPEGSYLVQSVRGKYRGKYSIFNSEGMRNSLKRFANIPLYIAVEDETSLSGCVFEKKEDAEQWANDPHYEKRYIVKEIILTEDQIIG